MLKLYLALAIILAAAAGYWRYDYVVKDRDAARAELSNTKGVLDKERQNAQEAANRSLAFRIEESNREEELNKLRTCVAAGKCGIRMRYQACPAMPATNPGGPEIIGTTAEPEREFQQWYFNNIALIDKYELRVKALQEELIARSKKDYCKAK